MKEREENNKNVFFWIIILLLIIIILLLLFRSNVGIIDNGTCPQPYRYGDIGHVDIFDISIYGKCYKDKDSGESKCPSDTNGSTETKETNYPIWNNEEVEENEYGTIYALDDQGRYAYQQKLKIFENPFYEYQSKIAPGVSNSYSFIVRNESTESAKYSLEMYKTCNYDIDLKYRLKKNGQYVIGDNNTWVSVDELKTEFSRLSTNDNDSYMLDWKWEYEAGRDDIDTSIGENMTDEYKLNIVFYVEQE